jgi:hypothetical protein
MDKNKKKVLIRGVLVFISAVSLLFLYNKFIVQKKYSENGRYTTGTINDFNSAKGGVYVVNFSYNVNHKLYNEYSTVGEILTRQDIGKRFLVTFVHGNEKMSYIDLKNPIPNNLLNVPSEGWLFKPTWTTTK